MYLKSVIIYKSLALLALNYLLYIRRIVNRAAFHNNLQMHIFYLLIIKQSYFIKINKQTLNSAISISDTLQFWITCYLFWNYLPMCQIFITQLK